LSSDVAIRGGPAERAAAEERERQQRQAEQEAERMRQKMQEEAEQRRQEALAAAEELKKKVRNIAAPNVQSFETWQVKAKPRTPPPVDEAAERERAALGDKISQLQERMRLRKEELAKQKDSETQAAAAGPSLSDLEKQKMEKMRLFIAQARDSKGIAPGQSAISSLGKPSMLSPLGGLGGLGGHAEGSHILFGAVKQHANLFENNCLGAIYRAYSSAGGGKKLLEPLAAVRPPPSLPPLR
jgi:hypothetical protein